MRKLSAALPATGEPRPQETREGALEVLYPGPEGIPATMLPPIDEILANFEFLDDWDERYRYLIELGRMLPPMAADLHTEEKLVPGCQSKVWLDMNTSGAGENAVVSIAADSDAHITKGLVAFLVALYSGQPARTILQSDALQIFRDLGLGQHITSKRSNGLRSMVDRIRGEAARVAAAA